MVKERKCDECGEETQPKFLGKVRGISLCKKCKRDIRLSHRIKTKEQGREFREKALEQSSEAEKGYKRKEVRKTKKEKKPKEAPVPKGSKKTKAKKRTESYLGFQDSQVLLGILVKRGLSFEEAKESVKVTKEELARTREEMRKENKPEEAIKKRQQEMLEELWNY